MAEKKSNKQLLFEYAGLGFQLLVTISIAIYAGKWLDDWIKTSVPVFLWLLPLMVIIVMIFKAIKDTSNK
ncbi:MAG TPA: AtpZ/AtpI family protein [Panacibacter sp.]|nr:AtpZ/AtpI family protein [Panacibacter sp.]HNP44930.1 AtpZ/AtpI family protein [Panacibacter sp.]